MVIGYLFVMFLNGSILRYPDRAFPTMEECKGTVTLAAEMLVKSPTVRLVQDFCEYTGETHE